MKKKYVNGLGERVSIPSSTVPHTSKHLEVSLNMSLCTWLCVRRHHLFCCLWASRRVGVGVCFCNWVYIIWKLGLNCKLCMQNLGLSSTAVQRFCLYLDGSSRTCSNTWPWSPGTQQHIQHLSVYSMDTVLMKAAILIGSCILGQKHAI